MKMAMRFVLGSAVLGLVALGAGVAVGWRQTSSASPAASAAGAPAVPEVTTVHPRRETIRLRVAQPGQIEGFEQTPLFAKVAGYVRKFHADIGDRVRAGQVLAELSVPELDEELNQKEAGVGLARAGLTQARRALKAAEASLLKAEAAIRNAKAGRDRAEANVTRWEAEYDRVRRLLPTRAVDRQTGDATLDQLRSARAALDESKASIELTTAARAESAALRDQAEANVRVAEAKLKVAEADRARTAALVGYTRLKAPFDGVVTRRTVDTGHLVQPSSGSSSGGAPLFVVVRTDPVRIFVDVPQDVAGLVRAGTPARVRVEALQGREFEGRVARSSWALDDRTRTLRTQIDLPNPDGLLRPGMYASASLTVERTGALTLPVSAVLTQDDEPAVVCVEGGKAVRAPVKLGSRQGGRVEVLRKQRPSHRGEPGAWKGFTGEEEVVASGAHALADGQAVRAGPAARGGDHVARAGRRE
jgi:HlyD family secretion protein